MSIAKNIANSPRMLIFIGWAGTKSKLLAQALSNWIPAFLSGEKVEVFVSSKDIKPGTKWREGLQEKLQHARVGIFCFTDENLHNTWMHYEAGAISNNYTVIPFLFDVDNDAQSGIDEWVSPLKQHQYASVDKLGMEDLIISLNEELAKHNISRINETDLRKFLEDNWANFEAEIKKIRMESRQNAPLGQTTKKSETANETRLLLSSEIEVMRIIFYDYESDDFIIRKLNIRERMKSKGFLDGDIDLAFEYLDKDRDYIKVSGALGGVLYSFTQQGKQWIREHRRDLGN